MFRVNLTIIALVVLASCSTAPAGVNAAFQGDVAKLQALASEDPSVFSQEDRNGVSLLMNAAYGGHADTIKFLIGNGADVNERDNFGRTALYLATNKDHADVVSILADAGADPDIPRTHGGGEFAGIGEMKNVTPLLLATYFGFPDTVEALIAAGADVNSSADNGLTPLTIAQANILKDDGTPIMTEEVSERITQYLKAGGAEEGIDYAEIGRAYADRLQKRQLASMIGRVPLRELNKQVKCSGRAKHEGLSTEEFQAIKHILGSMNHPGETFCLNEVEVLEKFPLRGNTVVKFVATIEFPIGYNTKCIGYEQKMKQLDKSWNWEAFGDVTSGGCNAFGVNMMPFKGPHRPGTIYKVRHEATI